MLWMTELKKTAYFWCVRPRPFPYTGEDATMSQTTHEPFAFPAPTAPTPTSGGGGVSGGDPLTEVIRRGARTLLAQAVEAEVQQWIADHAHVVDERGHRQIVRNGHARPRRVVTGIGPVEVAMPRVHDRRSRSSEGEHKRFTSTILPR